jgi:hypothetical protein
VNTKLDFAGYFERRSRDSLVVDGEVRPLQVYSIVLNLPELFCMQVYTFDDTALIAHFNEKFSSVDPDGVGLLDRNTFKFVLQNLELELSEDQVMILYMEADVDSNFKLKYAPLIPRLATLAKEMMVRKQHGESGIDLGVDKEQVDYVVRGISKVPF